MHNEFKVNEMYYGFKLLEENKIDEIQSVARVFEHLKSGARLLHLENKDDNKVFCISFRTTPTDSTGVAHILEHSVLCGSRKFKTKDPFGDIAKSSLNTFLNAMTYPDRTSYPVASRNQKDFMNLMDVYLDAVLYPNIYENHQILRQEGWRYETDPKTDKLIYKGVVYSEMQGALSSPQEVLAGEIYKSLFPNTTYAFNSGGAPEEIPQLTQKNFEEFHSKFYHPSNSYIYLYGDQDLDECLKFINENYLINFDRIEIPSHIDDVKPFKEMAETTSEYSISPEENEENKSFFALNFVCGENSNAEEYLAMKILYNMLIESSASPIKLALLKEEVGESILNFDQMNMDPTKQAIFPIAVKNTDKRKREGFKEVIFETLRSLVKNGIDKKLLKASINSIEFELREADPWRMANKGLHYSGKVMESWLYDGNPLTHLKYENNLNKIKASMNDKYFENFIEKYMLNNNHCSFVVLNPKKGLEGSKVKSLDEKLQKYKASLSKEDLQKLKDENEKLNKAQIAEDTEEAKDTIPKLSIEEVSPKVEKIPQVVTEDKGVTILSHNMNTNEISYINLLFDASIIEQKYIPYIGLLRDVLGKLHTEKRDYSDLVTEIYSTTGGIDFDTEVYNEKNNIEVYYPKFIIKSKVLSENIPNLFKLINEIITLTTFDDARRIREVIRETKSKLQMRVINAGNQLATIRAYSCFSKADKYIDILKGAAYYEFLCHLEKEFENNCNEIVNNLRKVYKTIFNKNNLIISFVGEKEEENKVNSSMHIVLDELKDNKIKAAEINFKSSNKNQALVTASNVQYVVKAFDFGKLNYKYSGKMPVLQTILNSEYLYTRVRLQGGAYGCYMDMRRGNNIAFASYRDPNLTRTIDVYDEAYKFLEGINYAQKDMEKFIIGSVGYVYKPLTPDRKGEKATENYICGITYEDLQKEKDELLNTKLQDIKEFTHMVKEGMEQNYCCVAGNEREIKQNKNLFDEISMLL
ncbi:insulinase family protein [Haloimpatiens massiliensis]|uniref:insulinase family protein n=1 Tax=Haloimpatiens massiliensis TaxID=1658110 RepID=UPI000C850E94|nr:insulinase family protein [Haloimpatiens massiliensis]